MLKLLLIISLLNFPVHAVKPIKHAVEPTNNNAKPPAAADFQAFWKNFKKAALAGDKNAVSKMTSFPFTDQYQEIYYEASGGKKPVSCATAADFLTNYNTIFIPNVLAAIKADKFRRWSKDKSEDQGLGQQYYRTGLYILDVEDFDHRSYCLAFGKKDGAYKLRYIPYYE